MASTLIILKQQHLHLRQNGIKVPLRSRTFASEQGNFDFIDAGSGNDFVFGGEGKDVLIANDGVRDVLVSDSEDTV